MKGSSRSTWSKLVMSSGSPSGGSGSTKRGSLSGLVAWECRVVMSDLSGQAALDRVYLLRVSGFPAWLGMPGTGLLPGPGVETQPLKVVSGILN